MAKTALFQARKCPNLNCISIIMSLLTYITGFFMNFELLPILTNYVAAILDTGRRWRTQFWKGTAQESSQQSVVEIGSVVSEEKIFFNFIPPFF
jgi:hypothetical protein